MLTHAVRFAADSMSDHIALLNAYSHWRALPPYQVHPLTYADVC
jgi:hypothetical protein